MHVHVSGNMFYLFICLFAVLVSNAILFGGNAAKHSPANLGSCVLRLIVSPV